MNPSIPSEAVEKIANLLYVGNKIEAIKLHREATGLGLKESKDVVDEFERQLRETSPQKFSKPAGKGCVLLLLTTTFLIVLLWFALMIG
jgi:hypothetical protein